MLDAAIAFIIVISLVFARVPIAFAMAAVGTLGFAMERGWDPAIAIVGEKARRAALNDDLAVVPLFILMGVFVGRAGLSEKLYAASNAFLGHLRGGLAMATVVACGGFSAICGSSLATAATMAKVAMPSMRRYGYNDRLAAGAIAAGGTLGILIPPSVILVLYGIMARQDVGKLFAAGILPGLLGVMCYLGAVRFVVARRPAYGPVGERTPWAGRWRAMSQVWGVAALFVLVMPSAHSFSRYSGANSIGHVCSAFWLKPR
jgi:tripartite ATP-independent transporter DctM subunit